MFGWHRNRRRGPSIDTDLGAVPLRIVDDPGRRAPLLIALHGYGASAIQIETLLPLRPSRPTHVVAPEAFLELRDGGRAWFPVGVDDDGPTAGEAALELALDRLEALVAALRAQRCGPSDPVTVVGYSQGAVLVLEALLSGRTFGIERAAAFAGKPLRVPEPVPAAWVVPVFLANGTHDPVISEADHHAAAEALRARGHCVTARLDPVPHVIGKAAARELQRWLDSPRANQSNQPNQSTSRKEQPPCQPHA